MRVWYKFLGGEWVEVEVPTQPISSMIDSVLAEVKGIGATGTTVKVEVNKIPIDSSQYGRVPTDFDDVTILEK